MIHVWVVPVQTVYVSIESRVDDEIDDMCIMLCIHELFLCHEKHGTDYSRYLGA